MEAGIDEAGRGPVLGPLVVAGVAGDAAILHDLGCKDSKLLAPGPRERIARQLRAHPGLHVEIRVIAPDVLDSEMAHWSLNQIEIVRFRDIARSMIDRGASRIVVDAADVDAARFGAHVAGGFPRHVDFVSEHKADRNHLTVAAASIVAKVERDRLVAQLARRLERRLGMEMGTGYPSDPKTKAFLEAWFARFHKLPEGTRHSWAPARALLAPRQILLQTDQQTDASDASDAADAADTAVVRPAGKSKPTLGRKAKPGQDPKGKRNAPRED